MRTIHGSVPAVIRAAAWLYVARRVAIGLILLGSIGLAGFMVIMAFVLRQMR